MPVFMKVWAGSWLIASVTMDRMMQRSSATVARWGKIVLISWPLSPQRWNGCWGARQTSFAPWSWAIGMPRVNDSGIGCPFIFASARLVVERLQVRRAAGHVEIDDPLDLGSEMEGMDHAVPALWLS